MPLTTVSQGLLSTDAQYTGFKNRLINGDMVINQRGVTATNPNPAYVTDRWVAITYGSATVAQSSVAPAGFTNSLLWTTTSASAPSAAWTANISQAIEGFNTADFGWGTANAQTITLSFWVRSSVTGTYSVALGNPTSTNSLNTQARSYVATYTVNSANTWEQKTITITGDTSGTWATTNGIGVCVIFDCGAGSNYQTASTNQWLAGAFLRTAGSVNLQNSSGATWQITGVQLEKGNTATSFDVLSYGTELALCQRYCFVVTYDANNPVLFTGYWGTANAFEGFQYFPATMRVIPTLTIPTIGSLYVLEAQVAWRQASSISIGEGSPNGIKVAIACATNTSFAKGQGGTGGLRATGNVQFIAEL